MMQQAVQNGGHDHRIMKEFSPVGKRLVGCDDRTGPLIPGRDKTEEKMAFLAGDGRIADLVHNDQGRLEMPSVAPFGARIMILLELGDQISHGGEEDGHAASASLDSQGDSKMSLTHTRRSEKDDIFLPSDKVQIKKSHDLLPVKFGLEGELELVDGLVERESGEFEQGFDAPLFFLGDFLLQQFIQECEIALALGLGGSCQFRKQSADAGHSEAGKVRLKPFEDQGIAHIATPSERAS